MAGCRPNKSALTIDGSIYQSLAAKRIKLSNGWSLTPAGRSLPLGDLPMNIVSSPSGKYLAVVNSGYGKQFVQVFDAQQEKEISRAPIAKSWYGLTFSTDEKKIYASGGNDNDVVIFDFDGAGLKRDTVVRMGKSWPVKISPTGIALDETRGHIWIATKEDSSLYIYNLGDRTLNKKISLGAEAYGVRFSPDNKEIYVSLWGGSKILIFNAAALEKSGEIATLSHPNDLIFTKNSKYLFVAHSLDNAVSIIDVQARKVIEVLNAALYPDAPNGSTTNAVALSEDEQTLYAANADNNCLAVFDVSKPGKSRSKGFIPTGWYPTGVQVTGKKIFVTNGKGFSSHANPKGPQPDMKSEKRSEAQYIGGLLIGTMSVIDEPSESTLNTYSKLTYENAPYSKKIEMETQGEDGNPIPKKVGAASPIKYVFYIVKENRTYDQVLGDIKEGNGDPALCLFPEKNTPNLHALAREFVLLDNFYADGEVSADGHNWSMAAYANDYVEKTWPANYSGRGGNYDYEGTRAVAFPKGGFIWDHARKAGLNYRTYGEFAENHKASYPTLEGHFCSDYTGWSLSVKDVAREKAWEKDFDSLYASGALPRISTLRFGNDHTSGLARGAFTPQAAVADNDLAVGRFIEHLSRSPVWKESAVFVVEDDAQNGPDHVDAHRTTAYVASPFIKRHFVDHTAYTTSSMLRTIELILGMPPMSQYDAAAIPMFRSFDKAANLSTFTALNSNLSLDAKNVAINQWSKKSDRFNWAVADAVPDDELSMIVWKAVKGSNAVMPAPRRSAFVSVPKVSKETDKEDD